MPAFIWKGEGEGEDGGAFCSIFGLTFPVGQVVDCGHLLPDQVTRLRKNQWFTEVPDEAPAPKEPPPDDERTQLKAELDAKGINYDKRWGVENLRAALDGGEAAEEASK